MATVAEQPEAGAVKAPEPAAGRIAELSAELAALQAENARLRDRIRLLEKALFGPRTERLINDPAAQQVFAELLKEVEELNRQLQQSEDSLAKAAAADQPAAPARRRPRRSFDAIIPETLPEEIIVVDLPEEEKISLITGEPLVQVGEERSRRLAVRPPQYYVKVYVTPRYADPADPSCGVASAPAPDFAIPGGNFDESFIADVVVNKTAMHLPLYRQAEQLRNQGIEVGRQTLSRLYIAAAELLLPLWLLMKEAVIARGVVFADDTPVPLLIKGTGKTVAGRMWVYVAGGAGPPYRLFEFTRDRSGTHPAAFLKGFQGFMHADAYAGFDKVFERDGVFECGCWMHVRRKFFEALDAPPERREDVLRAIRNIYRYEKFAAAPRQGQTPEDRDALILAVRRDKIAPLIDWLFARTTRALAEGEVLPASGFAKAIGYMHNLGDALRTFLGDPRLKPDNGESERALRPLAIGRKNWMFAGCKRGGDATGILLSMVQTCRAMDIDPRRYIEDVLRRINGHPANRLQELLPGNWNPAADAN